MYQLIRAIHVCFIAFVLLAPFCPFELLLTYHLMIIPFLWFHWIINDNTCALTMIESKLRGVEPSTTFVGSVVNPIYEPKTYQYYIITAILFAITVYRLKCQYDFFILKATFGQIKAIMSTLI